MIMTVINVKNVDNKCLLLSVLAALHQEEVDYNLERVSYWKKYLDTLKFQGIELPVRINHVHEHNNDLTINM